MEDTPENRLIAEMVQDNVQRAGRYTEELTKENKLLSGRVQELECALRPLFNSLVASPIEIEGVRWFYDEILHRKWRKYQ